MGSKDFYEFGEEIQKIVQTAIDSNDFKELNQTVKNTVNDAMEAVRAGVAGVSGEASKVKASYENSKKTVSIKYKETAVSNDEKNSAAQNELYYKKRPGGEILGGVMVLFGFSTAVIMAVVLAGLFALNIALSGIPLMIVPMVIIAIMIALFFIIGIKGQSMRQRVKRFKSYRKILNGREFCDIEELAEAMDKRSDYVVKDLNRMIDMNWFLQGHIDAQKKHLMITDKIYEQYMQAMKGLEERQMQEKNEKAKLEDSKYTDEVRQMLIEGKRFVNHISECNEAIPGVEISAKISRLELIVSRIFAQVEKNPAVASELHPFMNYYLPTTEKLLNAYRDLDAQPVQGQNITDTKQEIEATIDTLNQAFEKLLDSFYEDLAWDVTTDISVLNTMLAKEGLTDDALTMDATHI